MCILSIPPTGWLTASWPNRKDDRYRRAAEDFPAPGLATNQEPREAETQEEAQERRGGGEGQSEAVLRLWAGGSAGRFHPANRHRHGRTGILAQRKQREIHRTRATNKRGELHKQ